MIGRRRSVVVAYPRLLDGTVYNLARAREAHGNMQKIPWKELYEKLKAPGEVSSLPYPGIGVPPRTPGGDLKFAAREDIAGLFRAFLHACKHPGQGHIIYVTGPKGVGKSCYLRGLAWLLFLKGREEGNIRIVCLWSIESAYTTLLAQVKDALRFTYCQAQDVLQEIDSLESLEGVEKFLDQRLELKERFYFIDDGAQVLDTGKDHRAAVDMQLSSLLQKAHVSIKALSPMADFSRKRKGDSYWVHFQQGFWGEEYGAYLNHASILGCFPQWREQIAYYGGDHPLSLSVLDSSCRLHARNRLTSEDVDFDAVFRATFPVPSDVEIANLLKDKDEWEEVVKLFVSSAEMSSIRALLADTLLRLSTACHSQVSMMEQDMRFVVGDPKCNDADYVTPYIRRIYTEGFREAEGRTVYEKTAWHHYCRYLLDQAGPINWAEMGWLVENLAAEVISCKGLNLNGMHIRTGQTQRFGSVPDYKTWISEAETGGIIYFLPLTYNYRSIDGLIVWRDASGNLHLLAIQVTVNDEKHQASAEEFMSFNSIINWIPEEHLSKWELHFVFLCTRSLPVKPVPECLKPMRSSGCYGNVKYSLHTVSFQDAFTGSVSSDIGQTLKEVAAKRYEALQEGAEKEAEAETKAIADAVAAGPSVGTAQVVAFIQGILSKSEFTKQKLENLAKHHNIAVSSSDTKPTLISKICGGVSEL